MLLFKCGTCVDFESYTTFRPGPEKRYVRACPLPYQPFQAPEAVREEWQAIVRELGVPLCFFRGQGMYVEDRTSRQGE